MLNFTRPLYEEKEHLMFLCRDNIRGCEAYSTLCLDDGIPDGTFWCGRDENGDIRALVFNNGDMDIKITGDNFPPLFSFREGSVMVYGGSFSEDSSAVSIAGKKLLDFYRLISGGKELSFDDERRYVNRLRAVNKGLSGVFCVYDNEKPVASAAVTAMNEKYALIGDVFTKEEFRNRGLASLCLKSAVSFCLRKKRIPVLFCEEKLCGFYEKAGFLYYGKM